MSLGMELLNITFEKALDDDVKDIIEVMNKSFYEDFINYGECPGYNITEERMAKSIQEKSVYKILDNGKIIGNISVGDRGDDDYFLHCLCVVPEYENKGVGQMAMAFIEKQFSGAKHWSLETPADKERNHYFYKKHGYKITKEYMAGMVRIVLFEK